MKRVRVNRIPPAIGIALSLSILGWAGAGFAQSPSPAATATATGSAATTAASPDPFEFSTYVDKGAFIRDEANGKPVFIQFDPKGGDLKTQRERQQQIDQMRAAAAAGGTGNNRTFTGGYLIIALVLLGIGALAWYVSHPVKEEKTQSEPGPTVEDE